MPKLIITGKSGDIQLVAWKTKDVERGDPKALETIKEAERIVEEARQNRVPVFAGYSRTKIEMLRGNKIDPRADVLILRPLGGG
ncbi:MAG: hypothetical protein M1150_00545 [Patescibacteria group bacterium]|nr:hypothetical protein [Patescibacteria group bacterium]